DLLYAVILHMNEHFDRDHMFDLMAESPETRRLFLSYFKHQDLEMTFHFHKALKDHRESALSCLTLGYMRNIDDQAQHMANLRDAMEYFRSAGKKCKMDTTLL